MEEPLVLLPGMMCDERLFSRQIAAISSKRRCIVPSLHGVNTMTGLAMQILVEALPRFALAGLSMGGLVAMEIIRIAPGCVTRLALMDTSPLADPPEMAAQRERQLQKVRSGEMAEVMCNEIIPNYFGEGSSNVMIKELCLAMAKSLGPNIFASQACAIQTRPDQCTTLQSIKIPTLVLCGEADQLCPVARHKLMHELIANSRLVVLPMAGHLPTLEQPQQTNEELKKWLEM